MGALTVIRCVKSPAGLCLDGYDHLPGLGVFPGALGLPRGSAFTCGASCSSLPGSALVAGLRSAGGAMLSRIGKRVGLSQALPVMSVSQPASCEAGSEVVEWRDSGMAEADVVASGEVARAVPGCLGRR